ncbi:MAG: Flp pilus assembly complex ATPase component TadA [Erysipelotrichaceae bacterium]|jgi:pilus assembly protein CpaF|nr:Flp pilus assembly complex ATPase component TadA [Erysipelotrichaceae bacterium]
MNNLEVFFFESFLKDLLLINDLTDISFNGKSLYYETISQGRFKYDQDLRNFDISHFIKQLANLSGHLFSYKNPILDISIKNFRINAVHSLSGRFNDAPTVTFTIRRLSSQVIEIKDLKLKKIILSLLEKEQSIIIYGKSGSGKTELQKYLLSQIRSTKRLYIIDNIGELSYLGSLVTAEVNFWQLNDAFEIKIDSLIKNALRSNPDWLVIAEVRGEELVPTISSALSGHPMICTMHADDETSLMNRMANIYQSAFPKIDVAVFKMSLNDVFPCRILMTKTITNKGVERRIEHITRFENGQLKILYQRKQ